MRLLVLGLAIGAAAAPGSAQTRIMPVGDSITQGGQGYVSYRYALWFNLLSGGFSCDFVGSRNQLFGGGDPIPALYPLYNGAFDRDHQGYWGWRTDQILAIITGAAAAAQPDVVLIHLGTNDIGQQGAAGVANADANLRLIIGAIRAVQPGAAILLGQVMPIGPGTSYFDNAAQVAPLNAAIADVAADLDTPQSPIYLVDHHTGFDLGTMMQSDGLHPNENGESFMAARWGARLATLLTPGDPPPVIPITNPSFENPALADGSLAAGPGVIGGWTFSGTAATYTGIFNPPAGSYPAAGGNGTPAGAEGANAAYLFNNGGPAESVSAAQSLAATLRPNRIYTLSVAIGKFLPDQPYDFSIYGGYRIELLAGSSVLVSDSDTVDPPFGEFRDAVAVISSCDAPELLLGQPLGVRLALSANLEDRSTHFDHIRLLAADRTFDGGDIQWLVGCLIGEQGPVGGCRCADLDESGALDGADVIRFIERLVG